MTTRIATLTPTLAEDRGVVIDASAVLQLLVKGPGWQVVEAAFFDAAAYAPDLLDVEVLHTLRRLWLADRMTTVQVEAALDVMEDLPVTRVPLATLVRAAWRHRDNLSAYDASYLALAEVIGARLLTRDRAFADVPGAQVPVEVLPT